MNVSWQTQTRDLLLAWRGDEPGWGYRPESAPSVEPTVLAALALRALDEKGHRSDVVAAADWLETLQQADGALGLSVDRSAPHWGTALALLLWSAGRTNTEACRRAADWLLQHEGKRAAPDPAQIYAHDASIPGWSWVEGTHSWVEPTVWAVLALGHAGEEEHFRTKEGRRLIRDRAIRTGGWNYGNSQVFGSPLRPQPGPTGLALLALAGIDSPDEPCVSRSVDYLRGALPATRAPQSLGWGLLGLQAWGKRPEEADRWLAAAFAKALARPNRADQMAYLLLAGAPGALELLIGRRHSA